MAIGSDTQKLAVMEMDDYWEPALPLGFGSPFSNGEKQQLLWGYPDVAWLPLTIPGGPHARTGESAWSPGTWSDAGQGFWGGWW